MEYQKHFEEIRANRDVIFDAMPLIRQGKTPELIKMLNKKLPVAGDATLVAIGLAQIAAGKDAARIVLIDGQWQEFKPRKVKLLLGDVGEEHAVADKLAKSWALDQAQSEKNTIRVPTGIQHVAIRRCHALGLIDIEECASNNGRIFPVCRSGTVKGVKGDETSNPFAIEVVLTIERMKCGARPEGNKGQIVKVIIDDKSASSSEGARIDVARKVAKNTGEIRISTDSQLKVVHALHAIEEILITSYEIEGVEFGVDYKTGFCQNSKGENYHPFNELGDFVLPYMAGIELLQKSMLTPVEYQKLTFA